MKQPRGFTLVEMLVVIAILAILASFLLPGLRKALDSSRQITCLSNVQKCGVAVLSFAADNNNFVPRSNTICNTWASGLLEREKPNPDYINGSYIRLAERPILNCPSANRADILPGSAVWNGTSQTYGAYGCKGATGYDDSITRYIVTGNNRTAVIPLSRVRQPPNWVLLMDSTLAKKDWFRKNTSLVYTPSWDVNGVFLCHGERANVWMVDGHAECGNSSRLLSTNNYAHKFGLCAQIFDDGSETGLLINF